MGLDKQLQDTCSTKWFPAHEQTQTPSISGHHHETSGLRAALCQRLYMYSWGMNLCFFRSTYFQDVSVSYYHLFNFIECKNCYMTRLFIFIIYLMGCIINWVYHTYC